MEFKVLEIAEGDNDVVVPYYPGEDNKEEDQHEDQGNGYNKIKCAFRSFIGRINHWWRCSSRFTHVVVSSFLLTILFGVFFMAVPAVVQALIVLVRHHSPSPYSAVALDEDNEAAVEQVIFIADEEKRLLMEQEKELKQ